jgi:CheY-like chemotaxis protein
MISDALLAALSVGLGGIVVALINRWKPRRPVSELTLEERRQFAAEASEFRAEMRNEIARLHELLEEERVENNRLRSRIAALEHEVWMWQTGRMMESQLVRSGASIVRVVEDEPDVVLALRATLQPHGIEIVETIDHFDRLMTPDPWKGITAAIVDLNLPTISGTAVLQYLREEHPAIRRIVLTGMMPTPERARELADDVILKPYDTARLLAALRPEAMGGR